MNRGKATGNTKTTKHLSQGHSYYFMILIILYIPKMKREMKVCTYKKVQLDCYVIKGLTLKRIRALQEIDNVALPLIFMIMGDNDIRSNVDSTLLVTSYLPQFDYHNSYHVMFSAISF